MERSLTVVGRGSVRVHPDIIRVEGRIGGVMPDYDSAVSASASAVSSLRKAVGEAGFDMDDLKTTSVSVEMRYENDEGGHERFVGYEYSHGLSITEASDSDSVGRLLAAIVSCESAPRFRMSYAVRDSTEAEAGARAAAVKDAKAKARELANAAGVKLGDLLSISYGTGDVPYAGARMMSSVYMDAVPEDVEFTEIVTVRWEIE